MITIPENDYIDDALYDEEQNKITEEMEKVKDNLAIIEKSRRKNKNPFWETNKEKIRQGITSETNITRCSKVDIVHVNLKDYEKDTKEEEKKEIVAELQREVNISQTEQEETIYPYEVEIEPWEKRLYDYINSQYF